MTKKPRTFVHRYIPCGCHVREGCDRCNHTGYRTEHVPLADAMAEVEEQNAEAFLENMKQTPDNEDPYCRECGGDILRHIARPRCTSCGLSPDSPTVGKGPPLWHFGRKPVQSPTVGKEHPMSCDRCGNVRNYKCGDLLPARLICSTCDCPTPHTPTVGKESLPCPFCGKTVQAYDGRDCRYCWRSTPVVDAPPYVYPFTCKTCGNVRDYEHGGVLPTVQAHLLCSICDRHTFHAPGGTPALLTPHSARPSGTQVGDQPYSDPNKGAKGDTGPDKEAPSGCPKCGYPRFVPVGGIGRYPSFDADGTLTYKPAYTFACSSCSHEVGTLPLTK